MTFRTFEPCTIGTCFDCNFVTIVLFLFAAAAAAVADLGQGSGSNDAKDTLTGVHNLHAVLCFDSWARLGHPFLLSYLIF